MCTLFTVLFCLIDDFSQKVLLWNVFVEPLLCVLLSLLVCSYLYTKESAVYRETLIRLCLSGADVTKAAVWCTCVCGLYISQLASLSVSNFW